MLKTSELTGAQLDYYVARAEGIPAEQLAIRRVPRTDWVHVVLEERDKIGATTGARVLNYSTDWAQGGPLIQKHSLDLINAFDGSWFVTSLRHKVEDAQHGDTPLQAICRAVVRAAFGDDVEEVPVCE